MKSAPNIPAREMEFSLETIYVDESVADHPLTLEALRRFPNTPVQHLAAYDETVETIRKTTGDVFGAGKRT
ncbi:MAG TPA: hypothetical protein DCX78_02285, partial [Nitrospina sp.]|nr:hypothetical protein [Nitrospina sp.]